MASEGYPVPSFPATAAGHRWAVPARAAPTRARTMRFAAPGDMLRPMATRYWLLKSEPESFSINDLARAPKQTTFWNGVRNYQARNLLRDELQVGDGVIFYHSNANPAAAVGLAEVVRAGYPDATQFDPKSSYHDPDATPDEPRWFMVDIKYKETFVHPLPLELLREVPALRDMVLLRRGSRLSVQPVTAPEWKAIVALGRRRA
jgi:predicted RNA-binding protein with PUA-like domain